MTKYYLIAVFLFAFAMTILAYQQDSDTTSTQQYKAENVEVLEPDCATCNAKSELEVSREKYHPQGKLMDDATLHRMKDFALYRPGLNAGIIVPFNGEFLLNPSAPPLRSTFEGINQDAAEGFYPPDTQIAAGPNTILQATNGAIRLASKTNTNAQTVNWNTFFNKPGAFLFDPKVFFDPASRRFIVVVLEFKSQPQTSLIRFAVSQSEDPSSLTQGWCRYSYNGKSQETWSDYPSLGINEKWIAISTNQFRFSDNQYAKVMVKAADATKLANNATSCPKLVFSTFAFPLSSGISGTIQFAPSYSRTSLSGTPLFAVSTNIGDSRFYDLWKVFGTGTAPTMSRTRVTARLHTIPPGASHKNSGADYDTDVNRVLNAVHRNGVVSFALATGCNFGALPNESCVRLGQITPSELGASVTFESDFGGGDNKFFWMPAVAANSNNDLAVIFQQSGATQFLGAAFSGKRSGTTALEPFKVLQAGKCNLVNVAQSDTRNRTGDYAGISVDAFDARTFWISAEYSANLSGKCKWSTRIGKAAY